MRRYLIDTHAFLWFCEGSAELSPTVKLLMRKLIYSFLLFALSLSYANGQNIFIDSLLYQGFKNNLTAINDSLDIYEVDEADYITVESALIMPMVATLSHFLKNHPHLKILVGVHISCREDQSTASEITQAVADNIKQALLFQGIEKQRLKAYGLEPCLQMDQSQEENKPVFRNFRVTIKIIGLELKSDKDSELLFEDSAGKIVLDLCVNANGFVLYVKFAPEKSNAIDKNLIDIAIANAYTWKFNASTIALQCGNITYDVRSHSDRR